MNTRSIFRLSTTTLTLLAAGLLAPHAMASDKDTLNAADVKFVKTEAAAGKAEVRIADLGVKKAGRIDVKAFAKMLATDHTGANEEMLKLAAKKGVEVSEVIDPDSASTYQKLEKTSGTEFDKEFLAVIVSDHKKCVSNFEEASKGAKDADVKIYADKMLPTLKAHLEKAKELSAK